MLSRGRYRSRIAGSPVDVARAQRLRHLAFHGRAGLDRDPHDAICTHMLIEDSRSGRLVCCFRYLPLPDGRSVERSYSARFYDLSGLASHGGAMVEMGRFCIAPGLRDPDILRIAWGAMTACVDASGTELLLGCASFPGTDPATHLDAFAMLRARHLGPRALLPGISAPDVFRLADLPLPEPDERRGLLGMPPLLRSYLGMGGWVGDHAVVDAGMNTLHVFAALEVAAIPPARKRLLRAVAGKPASRADET